MKYNIPMRKAYTLLFLGIWIAILPHLGFPYSWKDTLTTLSGLLIIYVSFALYKASKTKEIKDEKTFDNFSENSDFVENKTNVTQDENEPGGAQNGVES